jgi:pimeloyl-ACP methyl ester carboxylesterase
MKNSLSVLIGLLAFSTFAADVQTLAVPGTEVDLSGGAVHGTLLMPKTAMAVPVVLLIAGSGPTDRDGNSTMIGGANNSLRLLAEGLAGNGIASLRYDKRGIGASAKVPEANLRFETYVDDAAAWCDMLHKDKRFSRVVIAGHSEGSLIGMLAAKRCSAAGVISLEGAGRTAGDILRSQLAGKLPPDLAEKNAAILASLEAGNPVADVPPQLTVLYRPSVQPYIISWLKYDPAKAIAELDMPVLIVQGTTDIQIGAADAKRLAAANPRAKMLMVEGMNHVLKSVPDDRQKQLASYGDPTLPLAPQLMPAMVELVKAAK